MILDYRLADLPAADQALCAFAVKVTLAPADMSEADIALLRHHGLSDYEITVATQVIAYFNYINRIAHALGVDPEPWMNISPEEWLRTKGRDYLGDDTGSAAPAEPVA